MYASSQAPSHERATRFNNLVAELRQFLRRVDPQLPEDDVLEEAVHHAARRLGGGDLVSSFVG
ncbi:MAG: hypothetical protein JWN79_2973 [Gemmatimonadetes bacterium]|jgi:hypothetical protein|nr:hypothetical protein [Gemmatimonadota bacterium]